MSAGEEEKLVHAKSTSTLVVVAGCDVVEQHSLVKTYLMSVQALVQNLICGVC